MSHSASGPEPSSGASARDSQEKQPSEPQKQQASAPGRSTQRNLLDQVLRQTALSSLSEQNLGDDALASLLQVARRYRGHPFELEPVAVELVHAALEAQFETYRSVPRDWRTISARVAETLFEDPVAHEQLEALWKRLSSEE